MGCFHVRSSLLLTKPTQGPCFSVPAPGLSRPALLSVSLRPHLCVVLTLADTWRWPSHHFFLTWLPPACPPGPVLEVRLVQEPWLRIRVKGTRFT